jgi:phosphoglycolate phosphatase (TIGR01487 family)
LAFKAFVLDIDGTICDYDGILNLEAVHSIRWLRRLGYQVILASGRGPWDAYYLGVFIGTSKIAVCENGGILMTSPADLKLFSDKRDSLVAYDLLCKSFDVRIKPVSARLTEVVLLRTFDPKEGQKILDQASLPVTIHDSKFALHLTKKGITKAIALKEALDLMNISPDETVVIGDSATDVPMFDICGYSVAVGNASDEVKSKADYVCKEEIGDGVVEAIQEVAKETQST